MDEKTMNQMAKMVDAVQPECDDRIIAAMTCSHAGAMSSMLFGKLFSGFFGGGGQSSNLPNPVFIAVGDKTVYAFKYSPRGFGYKIKKEVARWPKDEIDLIVNRGSTMITFDLNTASGESHQLEVTTVMGGKELVEMFIEAFGG